MKKLTYEYVSNYVIDNSNCELISKDYKGVDSNLEFRCECGEIFKRSFYNFRKYEKRCPICREKQRSLDMALDFDYVKNYIETKGAKLLSDKYENAKTKLNIQCRCGTKFKANFDKIKFRDKIR